LLWHLWFEGVLACGVKATLGRAGRKRGQRPGKRIEKKHAAENRKQAFTKREYFFKQASLAARQAAAYKKHEEASGYFVSVQMDR
jgi:hypothetical protein